MMGDGWNRMFNYQRDVLVKLPVWTTEEDRRRALSYADRQLDAQAAIDAVQAGRPAPADLGLIVAIARYEDAGWMPDGCFDRWRRWVLRGTEQKTVPDLVQWLEDVEQRLRCDLDFAMPAGLTEPGRRAYEIIVAYLKERGFANNGTCKAFYAPAEWAAREEAYGTESHLVVVYDGGTIRPVFSMDAAYDLDCAVYQETGKTRTPYGLYEGMQDKLREAGLYFEECTSWYSAIYSVEGA
jgi:hypothetical protein